MILIIEKSKRRLTLRDGDEAVLQCGVALGRAPIGPKEQAGDGRTPEGEYHVCLVKEKGKYGRSLGLDYPSPEDGRRGLERGLIDESALEAIRKAREDGRRPPWGTALGGEIYVHEGGTASDWTAGCVAVEKEAMDRLFPRRNEIEKVILLP